MLHFGTTFVKESAGMALKAMAGRLGFKPANPVIMIGCNKMLLRAPYAK